MQLGSFELSFQPRTAIKSQALVNFIAEWTKTQTPAITEKLEYWTMYFNGSLMVEGARAGIKLISPTVSDLNMFIKSTSRCSTMLPSMRLSSTGSVLPHRLES